MDENIYERVIPRRERKIEKYWEVHLKGKALTGEKLKEDRNFSNDGCEWVNARN